METSKARPCREMDLVLYLLSVSHLLRVPPNSSSVFPPVPFPLRRYFAGALSSSSGTPKGNHRPCGSLLSLTGLGNGRVYLGTIPACWPGGAGRVFMCLPRLQPSRGKPGAAISTPGSDVTFQVVQNITQNIQKKKKSDQKLKFLALKLPGWLRQRACVLPRLLAPQTKQSLGQTAWFSVAVQEDYECPAMLLATHVPAQALVLPVAASY